jgi:signal peptidase I
VATTCAPRLRLLTVLGVVLLAGCGGDDEKTYEITAASMEPTLRCAGSEECTGEEPDVAVVEELDAGADVRRGDIVLFEMPEAAAELCGANGLFFKRVIALPGETVETTAAGVRVDGEFLEEPYLKRSHEGLPTDERTLGENQLFLLGDYRFVSCDSRIWGPAPRDAVRGRVVAIERGDERIELRP